MNKKITKVTIKKYYQLIQKSNKKIYTISQLSQQSGIKEEVLREELANFDPLIRIMEDYNLKDLLTELENFLNKPLRKINKPSEKYTSIMDFVVKNMTTNGDLLDKYTKLSKSQLKDLEILVKKELRKKK